jgi:putative hemolysin
VEFLVIFLLIAINGFFALSEIAFVSSRREIIEAENERGSRSARLVLRMMNEPDRFLSSIQVGITIIGVISGAYGGVAIADNLSRLVMTLGIPASIAYKLSLFLVVSIITYFSIVLGELVPKTIGLKSPEKVILAVMPAVNIFSMVTHPVVSFLSFSTRIVLRLFHVKQSKIDNSDDPLKEILGIARAAAIKNKISNEQEGIIANTARLRSTKVNQIMVKRIDMKFLTTTMSLADALVASHVHHHTRFPLIEPVSGSIPGYINFKDIVNTLRLNPANPSLLGICRPVASFKETDTVNLVLRKLITTHQHIALVRDATDKVTGMITMEDILETIVGSIQDEYDVLPAHCYEISPGRFVTGGGATLKKLRTQLGEALPDDDRTIDLWIRERLGANLKVESSYCSGGLTFIIRKVSRSHVYELIIETRPCPQGEPAPLPA